MASERMRIAAVIPAAGEGRRFGSRTPKVFTRLLGKPLLAHTLASLNRAYRFEETVIAVAPAYVKKTEALVRRYGFLRTRVVAGGRTRAQSVKNAASQVGRSSWVLVHDAARPLVSPRLIKKLLVSARTTGAAICALPATATVKRASRGFVTGTEDRTTLVLAQTPQVFKKDLLLAAYRHPHRGVSPTDEAALFDGKRRLVRIVEGEARNIKITRPEDAELFRFYVTKAGR